MQAQPQVCGVYTAINDSRKTLPESDTLVTFLRQSLLSHSSNWRDVGKVNTCPTIQVTIQAHINKFRCSSQYKICGGGTFSQVSCHEMSVESSLSFRSLTNESTAQETGWLSSCNSHWPVTLAEAKGKRNRWLPSGLLRETIYRGEKMTPRRLRFSSLSFSDSGSQTWLAFCLLLLSAALAVSAFRNERLAFRRRLRRVCVSRSCVDRVFFAELQGYLTCSVMPLWSGIRASILCYNLPRQGAFGGTNWRQTFVAPKLAARQLPRHINRRNCRGTKTLSG